MSAYPNSFLLRTIGALTQNLRLHVQRSADELLIINLIALVILNPLFLLEFFLSCAMGLIFPLRMQEEFLRLTVQLPVLIGLTRFL